ncbi:hypothetical protein ASPZODRAFT_65760 [Penicilliopsis zonata CBS 506.65]|uniref:XPG N-terminal domain-containing protein n=1 Tax=Penicilliopsis zonata CBS 506.65 TaxID=1073090 RepID=A0A1L9SI63_9EURO|nr:hypothetical protein ASPZODRAFT_65760 [Penicilliopsis zonata CBS 506.65]OJJ46920.1 hypothetical protein ASPZODRAFT_65760 [Penicilliopsis zonata CBS 506.65]
MGVTGLWTVVQPCARPVKLETLNKKRLAVDASIWIYQFLKAVRDKEGNALRNSHVVGFFRRICKLLYFGIKPVFVFDGGAPVLKRQTIAGRKKRREGRREDAVRTAGKLLAVQIQRAAEEEAAAVRSSNQRHRRDEEPVPDKPVYVEEIFLTEKEKNQARHFRRKDAYHLPSMEVSLEEMGAPDDPRIMSREELEAYARQFHQGEDINLYDFSKIDFDSSFFTSLPATDRYNILNAARIRSRLRMGYSKEQLDNMFPDRMSFSKFQIERVKERNELTQRLMNLNGMNGADATLGLTQGQRIAGERGREYVLVQDSAVEGGWALGVVSSKHDGYEDRPIDVDRYGQQDVLMSKEELSDEDDAFEDVPVEGLNRLPKLSFLKKGVFDESIRQTMTEFSGGIPRQLHGPGPSLTTDEDDALFVEKDFPTDFFNREIGDLIDGDGDSEDENLRKAIAMSMEDAAHDDYFEDSPVNAGAALSEQEIAAAFVAENEDDGDDDDDEMDFATALAQAKKPVRNKFQPNPSSKESTTSHPFDGPLPFESIKIGETAPSRPSQEEEIDENAGGFIKEPPKRNPKAGPLPPWFRGERLDGDFIPDKTDDSSLEKYRDEVMTPDHQFLRNYRSPEVIDVDKLTEPGEVIDLEAIPTSESRLNNEKASGSSSENHKPEEVNPGSTKDVISTEPDETSVLPSDRPTAEGKEEEVYEWEATDDEQPSEQMDKPRLSLSPSPEVEFEDVEIPTKAIILEPPVETTGSSTADLGPGITVQGDHQNTVMIEDSADEGDMSDPEDVDLMRQLAEEAEEHARFAAKLNSAAQTQTAFDYEQELKQLRLQQKKDRRDADEVTQVMITECQQLLTLFGLPYITAPMEAEAQCAELVTLGLVDGIVTDDSDIFLFGGTRVYKNMFNQSKYVECYLTSDMEKEYALHRRKLISFAHLLGSDYTEGIPGIGPVTALEILTEFASLDEFRDWWSRVQMGADLSSDDNTHHAAFYRKFRKNASKIFLPPSFPNPHVDVAYLEPEVDADPSPFQWGVPDLNGLRNYLMATIGWSQERTDEILLPVIRDMNRREQEGTQSNITGFFSGPQGAGAFAPRVRANGQSRMEKAFGRLRQEAETQRSSDGPSTGTKRDADDESSTSKRKTRRKNRTDSTTP